MYSAEVEKFWGEEVYPKKVVVNATAREVFESRGRKRTHFKLDSNVGHVAWDDFIVTRIQEDVYSPKTYSHKVTLSGLLTTKLKNPKAPTDFSI